MRLPSGITVPEDRRKALRDTLSPLNLHVVGAALLLLLCLYFGVRLVLVSGSTGSAGDQAIVVAQSRVAAAELAAKPLRGVDEKLKASDEEAAKFYKERLPYAYSDVAAQIGVLAKDSNVRWSRASYVQAVSTDNATELRIDGSVTGDYRSLAHFINALERSKQFFLIENLALSGAQNGLVNLQMRIGTWIREPVQGYATAQTQSGAQP